MLVLSRKQGERLVVGDDITITITKCGRNRVVIGIDAPKDVSVKRGELICPESVEVDAAEAEVVEADQPEEVPVAAAPQPRTTNQSRKAHRPAPLAARHTLPTPLPVSA